MATIISIGAGHGLPDPGAVGVVKEYQVALDLAKRTQAVVERHGVKVVMLRTGEKSLSNAADLKQNKREDLNARVKKINESGSIFHCEIHLNSGGGYGYETLCYSEDKRVLQFHTAVQAFLKREGLKDRGIKPRFDLAVLRCKPKAVLPECLFVDHAESGKFFDGAFVQRFAEALGEGILAAVGVKYVPPMQNPSPVKPEPKTGLSVADADKIIAYLGDRWKLGDAEEKIKVGQLADILRVATGRKAQNG